MNTDHLYARTTRNRLEIANVLDSLDPELWRRPRCARAGPSGTWPGTSSSRCWSASAGSSWPRSAIAGHLGHRRPPRPSDRATRTRRAHRTPATPRTDTVNPPRVGPMGPFAETCIHLRDIARPLNLTADADRRTGSTCSPTSPHRILRPASPLPNAPEDSRSSPPTPNGGTGQDRTSPAAWRHSPWPSPDDRSPWTTSTAQASPGCGHGSDVHRDSGDGTPRVRLRTMSSGPTAPGTWGDVRCHPLRSWVDQSGTRPRICRTTSDFACA